MAELKFLTDKCAKSLCNNVRKLGGMALNLQAGVKGQPPFICNPGLSVPAHAENKLEVGHLLLAA